MITTKIPHDFARQRVKLSWRDVQFGLEHQLIAPQTAVDKAVDRSSEPGEPSQNEVDLASTAASEPVLELVGRLAAAENASADDVQAKWLYLVLAWVFESRASLSDPLATVEESTPILGILVKSPPSFDICRWLVPSSAQRSAALRVLETLSGPSR